MTTSTRYYVDTEGRYLGGFVGVDPPQGSVEVGYPPEHGWMVYNLETKTWCTTPALEYLLRSMSQEVW